MSEAADRSGSVGTDRRAGLREVDSHTEGEAEEEHDLLACRGGEGGSEPPGQGSSPAEVSAGRHVEVAAAEAAEAGEEGQSGAEDETWAATKRARVEARLGEIFVGQGDEESGCLAQVPWHARLSSM